MKAVWILHDIVLTDEIQDLLDELGVVGFSRWKRMTGRGPQSGTRLDNPVWPGANSGTFVVVADDVLAFAGVAPPTLRLYPLATHIAEKLHAYTMPRSRPTQNCR